MAVIGGFVKRLINITFRLASGYFANTQQNTAKAEGLRCEITISKAGSIGMPTLKGRVYGLAPDVMTGVSTLGTVYGAVYNNQVTVEAGDDSGTAVVFQGIITAAWANYEDPANPCLEVEALTGILESTRPLAPTSFTGPTDVAVVIKSIATAMGWQVENNGVSVILRSAGGGGPSFSGTGREQILSAIKQAHIHGWMDSDPNAANLVAIWPWDGNRNNSPPLISPETGMVGYPVWESNALRVKMLYNPNIASAAIGGPGSSTVIGGSLGVMIGGTIQVQSSLPGAVSGIWQVFSVVHELDSNNPDGPWFTTARCINTKWPNPGDIVAVDTTS